MLCAYVAPNTEPGKKSAENVGMGILQPDGVSARCSSEKDVCFSYYELDAQNKSKITIKYQGE